MQPELATQADEGMIGLARTVAQRLHLSTTLVKFLIVGGIGFLINTAMLWLFYDSPVFWFLPDRHTEAHLLLFTHPDIRLLISSVAGVQTAIIAQFNMHERWTFRRRPRHGWILFRFLKFNLSSIVSPIIVVVTVNVLTPVFGVSPYISNTIGVLIGVAWNWVLNTLVIWPQQRPVGEAE
jgi:putative flippase GtrA